MPKLWSDTIDAHRREVRRAIVEASAALVAKRGAASVTMSQVAQETGIGRATLYRYFADVDSILDAWHEEHVSAHIERLAEVRDRAGSPDDRLAAVLEAYGTILHERTRTHDVAHQHPPSAVGREGRRAHGAAHAAAHAGAHGPHASEIALLVHRRAHVARAQRRLESFFEELLKDAAKTGHVRKDIGTGELATFCVHALAAASVLPTRGAIRRLVALTVGALRAPRRPAS